MAKLKIKFTDDILNAIKCLNIECIDNKNYIEYDDNNIGIDNNNGNRFLLKDYTTDKSYSFSIKSKSNFGDNIYGIDTYKLFHGTFSIEDLALILGKSDKVLENTLNDINGPKFEQETQDYLESILCFIIEHLKDIEEILHQFCMEGIKPNVTYWCYDNERIWKEE